MTGKIIKGIAGFYYVNDGRNHVYQCKAKGEMCIRDRLMSAAMPCRTPMIIPR